jgi:outer membrane protein TolC
VVNWGHTTTPQSNTILVGTTELVSTTKIANFSIGQAFATGGSITLGYNNQNQFQNSFRQTINPVLSSNLDLAFSQPLLQGFGLALNNRTIRVAKNDLKAADLVFRQQLINTVANVVQIYWTLVAANTNVDVKKQAVEVSTRLVDQNQKQVEVGTLAPIEIVRAEAQQASDQQALVQAQSVAKQLEAVLKSALSRNGLATPAVAEADVVPLDQIHIPDVEPVQPIQDLVGMAMESRPDLGQSRIQLENAHIALQGTKNALLPTLNAVADLRNSALIGPQNTESGPIGQTGVIQQAPIADPFFIGGYGGILGQLFSRNFPNYSVGLNLNIPLRNRAAQANIATQTLNLRMNELQVQRQTNQIRLDIQNALIALQEARAQYQAAVKQRDLELQTVDADQKKLALGATTVYQLIQDQRDLSTAGGSIAQAEATYAQARVQLDIATGATLQNNNVDFDEAKSGRVTRAPSPLPPSDPNGTKGAATVPQAGQPAASGSR